MKRKLFSISCICFALPLYTFAQQTTATSGSSVSNQYGSVSISVGQIDAKSVSGTGGSVSPGVQVPFEVLTSLKSESKLADKIKIYPIPSLGEINIDLLDLNETPLQYIVSDLNGKKIIESSLLNTKNKINLRDLIPGQYIITIINEKETINTINILKH